MKAFLFSIVLILSSSMTLASDFGVGDIILDNFGGSTKKGEVLDISRDGLVKTTNTLGSYIKSSRIELYEQADSYRTGNYVTGFTTYEIDEVVFDTFANTTTFGGVSMWNKGKILDITMSGLVKTTNTIGAYIKISRLKKYERVESYDVGNFITGYTTFNINEEVLDDFAGITKSSRILDISENGLVKTTRTLGKYVEIERLKKK